MPRARNIKPGFFESEQVGQVPFGARLLFEALWLMADREGRLEDRPLRFKGFAFRYDPTTVEDIEQWLQQLEDVRLIDRYTVDRLMLIWIPKFKKHQNPHVKEKGFVSGICG